MKRFFTLLSLIGLLCTFGVQGATGEEIAPTCAEGGVCHVGDIGPGGGMVFFVRNWLTVARWSYDEENDPAFLAAGWKYLEVAPKTWAGGKNDPKLGWCNNGYDAAATWTKDLQGEDYYRKWRPGKTLTPFLVGTGFDNSEIISKHCKTGAATAARKYRGGGKSDWYLPRWREMQQLRWFAGGKSMFALRCWCGDFPTKQSAKLQSSVYAFNWTSGYWASSFAFGRVPSQNWGGDSTVFGLDNVAPGPGLPYARPIRAF
jgi:hypothetical protein